MNRATPSEPVTAVLPTVWMLTVGVTALAEVTAIVSAVLAARSENVQLAMMAAAAMFAAAVVGLIVLILTALVKRTLQPPPPKSLVTIAVVVGVIPWAVLVVQLLT